ncbi:MAG: dihydrodipicolinate synthase family protein [Verrucomicrobia subdivision 3 bacterium]|nr:dihydrodipicolinate synthase family protein [Limisphaerales bacterium]
MDDLSFDPVSLIRPRRAIRGISAILLPFQSTGEVDWPGFTAHIQRTVAAGLAPAVNMDTGYAHLIDDATRTRALELTRAETDDFVAGAFVGDAPGAAFKADEYFRQMEMIQTHGGVPVVFQSFGLTSGGDDAIVANYTKLAEGADAIIGFELNDMIAPFGKIYSLEVFRGLLGIKRLIGSKHSSFEREPEWRRLMLRDELRPEFRVFTGNDLAIDMVMYGSDYLLGLSTFAPDVFAQRDAVWAAGDPAFYELNDWLQYLGFLTFRPPVPAYKHSAAMFLKLRGWLDCDATHPNSPTRPESDREILHKIVEQIA